MSSSRHFSDSRRVGKAPVPEKFNFVQTCNLLSRYIKKKGSLRNLNFEIGGNVESLESIMRPGSSQLTPIDIEDASNESTSSEDAIMESNNAPLTMFYAGRVLVFDDYPAEKAKELVHLASNINSHMATSKEKVIPDSGVPSSSAAQEWLPPLREANNSVEIGCILSNTFKEKMNTCGAMASSSGTQEWLLQQPQAIGSSKANCIISNPVKQKVIDGASSSGAREWLAPEPEANGSCKASGLFSYPIIEKINTGDAVTSTSSAREWLQPPHPEANVSDLPIARRSSLHRFLEKRKDRAGARGPYQIREQPASSSKSDEQLELKL